MSDDELSPIERLKQQMADAKDPESKEDANTPTAPEEKETTVKSTASKKKAPAKKKPVKASKKPAKKKAAAKKPAPAKKKPVRVAKKKGAEKKAAPAKKPAAKKAPAKKEAKAPAKKKAAAKKTSASKPVKASASREMVRDRKGDGLTPVERKIIAFIAEQDEPVSVVTIGRRMFGQDCPSEGENSFRTVRNALRFPVKYGMVDMVKNERGLYKIGVAYKRSKGNLTKLAERYRDRVAKERKAS